MAGKDEERRGKWNQKAWTPARCAVWKVLVGERQKEFERWVEQEPPFGYPEQVSSEWQAEAAKA